jgi:phosphopantothenoylcysteine synthetase/decarboxylase
MRLLITAGPTREPIDPVRFLSNRSSGRMGYALAEAACEVGHDVVLVSGPVTLPAPGGVSLIKVETAQEMFDAVQTHLSSCDAAIFSAAVADYRPALIVAQKLKKTADKLSARTRTHRGHPRLRSLKTRLPRLPSRLCG